VQPSVSRAHGISSKLVADVHSLARMHPEGTAGPSKDSSVWLGHTELPGDQHRIKNGVQAQRSELSALVLAGGVGDRGQLQSKIPQRPQAWQRIVEEPPGTPDGSRAALLSPEDLTIAQEFTPPGKEVFSALLKHRFKTDLPG
jgi:hypothetical protein